MVAYPQGEGKAIPHSGAMPTGRREAQPDDRLRIEPGIQRPWAIVKS
jgi:hypothetical protein